MSFKNIVGHEKLIRHLKKSIKIDKIGHAYIFDGPVGIGKKTTATAFSKGVLCKEFGQDVCEVCSSCSKVESNNHPDLVWIEPDGKSIKNHQIEELQQDLVRKPYESEKKVYIIKDADLMTESAQNRLLKTLEEPPKYVVIILISTNSNRFLATIRSRSQIIKFNPLQHKMVQDFMHKRYGMDVDETKVFATFSNGIIGKAIEFKESEDFQTKRKETIALIEGLISKDALKIFDGMEFFEKYKEDVYEILDLMVFWFRDILLLGETNSEQFLINIDQKDTLQKHLYHIGHEKMVHMIETIERTKKDIKANVNFQLATEIMILRIQEV